MTNEEIDEIIARQENSARLGILSTPLLGWLFSLFATAGAMGSGFAEFFVILALGFGGLSIYASYDANKKWKQHHASARG